MLKFSCMFFKILLIIANLCWYQQLFAADNQILSKRIQDFWSHNFLYNHVGLVVQRLDTNQILFNVNQDKLFVPASLTKLFTLGSSLKGLGAQFKFNTTLSWKNNIKNHNLDGDLAITFTGDPSFNQQDLENLIIKFKQYGIRQISGNLIIDDGLFSQTYAKGWLTDDLIWGYAAPSSTVIIAKNRIPIAVDPITSIGQSVKFYIQDPHSYLYSFLNIDANVVGVGVEQSLQQCNLDITVNSKNDINLSGCAAIEAKQQNLTLALNSPRQYLQDLLIKYFKKHNINLLGDIVFTAAPKNFTNHIHHSSENLLELAKFMIKNSDNIYAHSLGKSLGVKWYGHGTFQTASKAITNILHKHFSINTGTLNLVDSSGLSVYNVATPNHFIRLFQAIYNDKYLYQQVSKILSSPGDGTLTNRLMATDLCNNIVAKTGTLKHSVGLSGYIKNKRGINLAFVLILNNLLENDIKTKQLIDEFIEILINYD